MSMDRPLTGKIPRERIGALELPRLPPELLSAFRALEDLSGVVSDALDELGIAGAIPASLLKSTDAKARICGPALTVLNRPLDIPVAKAVQANVSRLGEIEAHNLARSGDVLVIQGVEGISSMGAISASIFAEITTEPAPSSLARSSTKPEKSLPLAAAASSTLQT